MKKQDMLKKNKEFRYVVSRGKSQATPSMVLICAKFRGGVRAGFSVSSKLGNAVIRNRTKRVMRAGLDPLWDHVQPETAYLFIARHALIGKKAPFARQEMETLLRRAGKLK
ncbi:MAG: ribonuclease P protein component [Clostridia bacterium]|nr:ribonuclease P protein component [Clostridia bacterium]